MTTLPPQDITGLVIEDTPPGPKIASLTVVRRRSKVTGTIAFSARWTETHYGSTRYAFRTLAKTGKRPTKPEISAAKRAARAELAKVEEELGIARKRTPARVTARWLTPAQVIGRYTMWSEGNGAKGSAENDRRACDAFLRYLELHWPDIKRFKQLSVQHVKGFREWRLSEPKPNGKARSPNSVRHEMGILRSLWEFALENDYAKTNEAKRARLPAVVETRTHVPETETVLAVIHHADPVRRAALYLLAATGMRQGELRGLRGLNFDRDRRTIDIPRTPGTVRRATKQHERVIPLGPGAMRVLAAAAGTGDAPLLATSKGRPLSSQINAWLKPFKMTPHDLRRWFYTTLESLGYPQYVIDDLVGHAPSKSAAAYRPKYGTKLETLREAIEKIDAILAG